MTPDSPIAKKNFKGSPAANKSINTATTNTNAEPKSGWIIINPIGNKSSRALRIYSLPFFFGCFAKASANTPNTAILDSSAGWKLVNPRDIQL